MALSPTARSILDTERPEDIWEYLARREGCDSGQWWMHALFADGGLRMRRFELDQVRRGQLGPIRAAEA